jgi:sulfite reductase (NADPH) flavoprotein alpha-component
MLVQKTNLTPQAEGAHAYQLWFRSAEPLGYQAGDWLTVKGQNSPELVEAFIERLGLSADYIVSLKSHPRLTLSDALTHYLELTLLDPALLNKLVRQKGYQNWSTRQEMQAYAKGKDLLDLLDAFPELATPDLLDLMTPLYPRYYSIASAPCPNDLEVAILFKKIEFHQAGRWRYGVTSSWLAGLNLGDSLEIEIKPNGHFKLPQSSATPIIMIAAGTGLAPFMGFVQARMAMRAEGKNVLFFGETHQATRFLHAESLQAWQAEGCLDLYPCFSRDVTPKQYVQDALLQKSEAWLPLWQSGAVIYICGAKQGMAQGVELAIKQAWSKGFGWCAEQAESAWQEAKQSKRIQMDVY